MTFGSFNRIRIYRQVCPPKTWEWLCTRLHIELSRPVIELIDGSEAHREFRNLAWMEFHENTH